MAYMSLGWIWTDNLRPLLTEIGLLVEYRFDDSDWTAFQAAILETDSEAGRWFDYQIRHILVSVALEPGADEVASVRTDAATEAELEKIRWLISLMQNWHLSDASGT